MWDKKYQIAVIAAVVLVVIGTIASQSGGGTLEEKMLDAFDDHEHENAFIYASKILTTAPNQPNAKRVLNESGQILYYLASTKDALANFKTMKDGAKVRAEDLYLGLQEARSYTIKAIALDKNYEVAEELGEKLDEAQTTLIYIFAKDVIKVGASAVSTAEATFQRTSDIVDSANSSKYLAKLLPVQSAWATVNTPVNTTKEELGSSIEEMEKMSQLISNYGEGKAAKFIRSLVTYTETVETTIDTLLYPNGSYVEFMKQAETSKNKYNKAQNRLEGKMPGSTPDSYIHLVEGIVDYPILKNPDTKAILYSKVDLYSS